MDDAIIFIIMGLFAILGGLFSFFGATQKWKIFIQSRKVRFIIRILGEKGMIIFYQIIGIMLAMAGILSVFLGILTLLGKV